MPKAAHAAKQLNHWAEGGSNEGDPFDEALMDTPTQPPAAAKPQPPVAVRQAMLCLWVSWAVGFARNPLRFNDPAWREQLDDILARTQQHQEMQLDPETMQGLITTGLYVAMGVGFLISLGVTAWITHKLKRGRDWARILCLIYGAYSLLGLLDLKGSSLHALLTALHLGLGGYALYLLFSAPGAAWFRKQPVAAGTDAKW